jgi:hypothetical protein
MATDLHLPADVGWRVVTSRNALRRCGHDRTPSCSKHHPSCSKQPGQHDAEAIGGPMTDALLLELRAERKDTSDV